ncbi:MAG: phytanoyl-CoA dioxygenase family protein [Acidobacteriota bacterium]|nr:phytanoyl-CoA dioxygenase family protein [Acidobacteriota bacterium]
MLTAQQISQYRDEGYTILHEFLSRSAVDAILSDIEDLTATSTVAHHDAGRLEMEPNQKPEGRKVRRIYEPCSHYPRFRALSESMDLLDVIEQLIGPNLIFHLSKINMKPAVLGSVVDWHQDLTYYPLTNTDSVTVLFYLEDADASNGCLQVIPCAHRSVLNHTSQGLFQGRVTGTIDASKSVFLAAKAGSAILMHCLTPHSSAPNNSPHPRTTLIMSYRAADAFPIHLNLRTEAQEAHARLVRGKELTVARFGLASFPIPHFPRNTKSLYELQEMSRKEEAARV